MFCRIVYQHYKRRLFYYYTVGNNTDISKTNITQNKITKSFKLVPALYLSIYTLTQSSICFCDCVRENAAKAIIIRELKNDLYFSMEVKMNFLPEQIGMPRDVFIELKRKFGLFDARLFECDDILEKRSWMVWNYADVCLAFHFIVFFFFFIMNKSDENNTCD